VVPVYYRVEGATQAADGSSDLVRLPRLPHSTLVHVYGGGFVNDWWGRPVRQTIGALVERHARDHIDGQLRLFMSGLQVSRSAEADNWGPLFARAEYIGARDPETVTLLRRQLNGSAARVRYSGDDALLALAGSLESEAEPVSRLAAHINCAHYASDGADRRLERVAAVIAAGARHVGVAAGCDLLVAYPAEHVGEQEAARHLEDRYLRLVEAGTAPAVSFRVRNIFEEAVRGRFQFDASLLVTCSYHVALTGLLCRCPTLLMVDNDYYRQKVAGLTEAFGTHRFAAVEKDDDAVAAVGALLEERLNRPADDGSHAMWSGQADKVLRLSRVCLDMERAVARNRLELTASAFREVAADLGELRKRRILEEKLAKEVAEQTAVTITIPATSGLTRYLAASYWRRRRAAWVRSIKKRVNRLG
jgi:polysaccharide pyruvyl transferase WcaK-like protein